MSFIVRVGSLPRDDNQEQTDVDPAEQSELLTQVLLVQVSNETDETCQGQLQLNIT